jgi:hypothetical protein
LKILGYQFIFWMGFSLAWLSCWGRGLGGLTRAKPGNCTSKICFEIENHCEYTRRRVLLQVPFCVPFCTLFRVRFNTIGVQNIFATVFAFEIVAKGLEIPFGTPSRHFLESVTNEPLMTHLITNDTFDY